MANARSDDQLHSSGSHLARAVSLFTAWDCIVSVSDCLAAFGQGRGGGGGDANNGGLRYGGDLSVLVQGASEVGSAISQNRRQPCEQRPDQPAWVLFLEFLP